MKKEKRFKIVSDGDHEYFIELDRVDDFYEWLEGLDGDHFDCLRYEDNRIDGNFTFTDPRLE